MQMILEHTQFVLCELYHKGDWVIYKGALDHVSPV